VTRGESKRLPEGSAPLEEKVDDEKGKMPQIEAHPTA